MCVRRVKLLYAAYNFSLDTISPGQFSTGKRAMRTVRADQSAEPDCAKGVRQGSDSLPALPQMRQRVQWTQADVVVAPIELNK